MSASMILPPPELLHLAKSSRAYPIRIGLEYRIMGTSRIQPKGAGKTVSLSSRSVVFESDAPLPPGLDIELALAWPVRLEKTVELKLCIRGRTAQGDGNCTEVLFDRHEFRTRAPAAAQIKTLSAAG